MNGWMEWRDKRKQQSMTGNVECCCPNHLVLRHCIVGILDVMCWSVLALLMGGTLECGEEHTHTFAFIIIACALTSPVFVATSCHFFVFDWFIRSWCTMYYCWCLMCECYHFDCPQFLNLGTSHAAAANIPVILCKILEKFDRKTNETENRLMHWINRSEQESLNREWENKKKEHSDIQILTPSLIVSASFGDFDQCRSHSWPFPPSQFPLLFPPSS